MKKPNILLLFSDQHSARVLGCYGNKEVHTPNLDKLAKEGVVFTNAFTQNTICTPSRMCYMSGQYVHNFGFYGLMGKAPVNLPSIFSHFKKNGYTTGMAGKIHTPTGWLSKDCDYVADGYGYETPPTKKNIDGLQGTKGDDYNKYLAKKGLKEKRDDKFIDTKHKWSQGLDARFSNLGEDDTIEAWTAGRTVDFIEKSAKKNKPFCFWMTVPRPHQTYVPAEKFWDLYDESKLSLPPNSENDMKGRHISARQKQKGLQKNKAGRLFKPDDWESYRRRVLKGYYGCVSQVDDAIGRITDKLDELGIRENTIIVYATDHGEFAGEHGMIEKAPGIAFRCVTRIPYIWSWKGHLPENKRRDCLVETVDFLPTVCALAGIDKPDWVDGVDITSAIKKGKDLKDIAVTEAPLTKTLHTKRYKFTQYLPEMNNQKDFGELYDMKKDPWELKNLYFDEKHKRVVEELRLKLYQWLVKTTRNVTVDPLAPDLKNGWTPWDFAEGLKGKDKKVGFDIAEKAIKKKYLNYL